MKLGSHLDGQKAAQLINILFHKLNDYQEANDEITAESQFGFVGSNIKRLVFFDGEQLQTVATIDDVYDGYGNTTYIGSVEPPGLPSVGLIRGDMWFNDVTSEIRVCINPTGLLLNNRWTNISNVNVTYTIPLVESNKTYAALSVFVYSNGAANVSNGTESIWQNQTGADLSSPASITSEADLANTGFKLIGGGSGGLSTVQVTLLSSWIDGAHVSGTTTVTKTGNSYTIDLVDKSAKTVVVKRELTGKVVQVDTTIGATTVTILFGSAITENFVVTMTI